MKHGIVLSTMGGLLIWRAIATGGPMWLLLWPAASALIVAAGYLGAESGVFGKRQDGTLPWRTRVILAPYLLCINTLWFIWKSLSREFPVHHLRDSIYIGRRLLSREVSPGMQTVVDLTSEFTESTALRSAPHYVLIDMLDGGTLSPKKLAEFARGLTSLPRPIYIHCAQGHGRTALVAALLLIALGEAPDPDEGLQQIKQIRPGTGLNTEQRRVLDAATNEL